MKFKKSHFILENNSDAHKKMRKSKTNENKVKQCIEEQKSEVFKDCKRKLYDPSEKSSVSYDFYFSEDDYIPKKKKRNYEDLDVSFNKVIEPFKIFYTDDDFSTKALISKLSRSIDERYAYRMRSKNFNKCEKSCISKNSKQRKKSKYLA